jgi:Flp pilus assembly protein TadG
MSGPTQFKLDVLDQRGVAAVEFALIAPVLAVVVAGIALVAPFVQANNAMRDGLTAGSRYVMAGGTSPTVIQSITLSAWPGHGSSATATVTQYCSCAGVQNACTNLCADGTVPQGYTVIQTSSPYGGSLTQQTITAQQTIRTR